MKIAKITFDYPRDLIEVYCIDDLDRMNYQAISMTLYKVIDNSDQIIELIKQINET